MPDDPDAQLREALDSWRRDNPPKVPFTRADQIARRYNRVLVLGEKAVYRALDSNCPAPPTDAERYLLMIDK